MEGDRDPMCKAAPSPSSAQLYPGSRSRPRRAASGAAWTCAASIRSMTRSKIEDFQRQLRAETGLQDLDGSESQPHLRSSAPAPSPKGHSQPRLSDQDVLLRCPARRIQIPELLRPPGKSLERLTILGSIKLDLQSQLSCEVAEKLLAIFGRGTKVVFETLCNPATSVLENDGSNG